MEKVFTVWLQSSTFRKQGMQRAGRVSSGGRTTVKPGLLVCGGLGDLEDQHNRDVND